jgi:DMSO/TMAO reductase YedYZ molybdopterin-dependent catalytic subunit
MAGGGKFSNIQKGDVVRIHKCDGQRELQSDVEKGSLEAESSGAGGLLFADRVREPVVEAGVRFSDWISARQFGTDRLAETFTDAQLAPFEDFPYNYYDVLDPEVDLESWTLTVEGDVARPGEYTLEQIKSLPHVSQNTRHICIEGWDVVGNFGGVRISDFLELIGARSAARFIEVECADDYYTSIDMNAARHPQSLLCYEMYGKPLDAGHGAPLRLQMPTKLGYKQPKYLVGLRVSNVLGARRGYWEDRGYSWYGGV